MFCEQEDTPEEIGRERCFVSLRRGRHQAAPHTPAELACRSSNRDSYSKRGTGEHASPAGGHTNKMVESMGYRSEGKIVA